MSSLKNPRVYSGSIKLDRKDNDGNYELGNVHWTTRRAQTHNRRSVNWANQYVRKTDKTAEHPQNQKPQSAATPKANQPPKVIVLH